MDLYFTCKLKPNGKPGRRKRCRNIRGNERLGKAVSQNLHFHHKINFLHPYSKEECCKYDWKAKQMEWVGKAREKIDF